jgi:hypothetical protein
MPKLKNPLFSQEARGGIGGLVYNTWRGISYVKTNTSPTGQGTPKRLAAQALIFQISKEWKSLSDVARAAWAQYAQDHPITSWTGAPMRITGQNWFMKCNVQLAIQGNAHITSPPVADAPDPAVGVTLSKDAADLFIDWTTPVAANLNLIFFLVGPLSAGVSAKVEKSKYQITYGANAAAPIVLKAAAPVGRYTVFAKVMDPTTGLTSTWTSDFFDMT